MTLEVVLCQGLGKYVSNLVFCVDREDLDKSLTHAKADAATTTMTTTVTMAASRPLMCK